MPSKPSHNEHLAENTDAGKGVAVGHIPSGLFIVCTQDHENDIISGYLASWIQQVSFKPLLVSIAVKPGRPAYDIIMDRNVFTVNIIGEHNHSFMKHFWHGYDPNVNPFDQLPIKKGENGGIILTDAKSTIECRMLSSIHPGDHSVIISEVLNSYIQHDDSTPLVHIRKTGLDY